MPRPTLNANHARRIAANLAYIEGQLQRIERLASMSGQAMPLSDLQPDVDPTEARSLLSLVDAARRRMLGALDYLRIPRPQSRLSARWSIMTALRSIDISLSDLTPSTLAGYGAVDAESLGQVSGVVSDLAGLIAHGITILQFEANSLRDRLATIDGPVGEILRTAESISTELGVAQVRPLIKAIAERSGTATVDVGVFGRVSSGKSSLINALIGANVLPVGATPVTAVPLRIVHGPELVEVESLEGGTVQVDFRDLPEWATEAGNPDNRRRIESIRIQHPLVADGLALLDTPGVGSLSQSGPAQAFASLPKCDLGVVLVAAGTPVGADELALIRGLTYAGIPVQILVSKSDLLSADDRPPTRDYVAKEVKERTGMSVPVRMVSIQADELRALVKWRTDVIDSLLSRKSEVLLAGRKQRFMALLGAMNSALSANTTVDSALVELHRARATAHAEVASATDRLDRAARDAIETTGRAVADAWTTGSDARVAAHGALLGAPTEAMRRVREAIDQMAARAGDRSILDRGATLPPLFDPELLELSDIKPAGSFADRWLGHARARASLGPLLSALDTAYSTFANRLRAWGTHGVDAAFDEVVALRAQDVSEVAPALRPLAAQITSLFPE